MGKKRLRNPFRGFMDHINEMNRMQEQWMTGPVEGSSGGESRTPANAWIPTVDAFSRNNDLIIRCELAGVHPDDVEITFSNGLLTITGQRRIEDEGTYYVRERFRGAFRRVMTLPEGIGEEDINAQFEKGLLEITVSGGAAAGPRRISVTSLD